MIDPDAPEAKPVGVLTGKTLGETRGRSDLEIVQDDDRAVGGMMQRQEKSVLALGGVGRTVDQNQPRLHQALKGFSLRRDVERLDAQVASMRSETGPSVRTLSG